MALPIRHRLLTTADAVAAARGSLLPYRLQRSAADEMLYGGTRVTGLAGQPPAVRVTRSEELTLPTLAEERADLGIDWARMGLLQTPSNVHFEARAEMHRIKNADLLHRLRALSKTHTPSTQLSIRPPARAQQVRPHHVDAGAARPSYSVFDARRFMPLQSIKPYTRAGFGKMQSRGGGLRPANAEQFQERLDRRGFGAQKNMAKHPNFGRDTVGYRPRRYY
jgi:hypothetical protein